MRSDFIIFDLGNNLNLYYGNILYNNDCHFVRVGNYGFDCRGQ